MKTYYCGLWPQTVKHAVTAKSPKQAAKAYLKQYGPIGATLPVYVRSDDYFAAVWIQC